MENLEKENEKCNICERIRGNLGDTNWSRHVTACEKNKEEKEKRKKKGIEKS